MSTKPSPSRITLCVTYSEAQLLLDAVLDSHVRTWMLPDAVACLEKQLGDALATFPLAVHERVRVISSGTSSCVGCTGTVLQTFSGWCEVRLDTSPIDERNWHFKSVELERLP